MNSEQYNKRKSTKITEISTTHSYEVKEELLLCAAADYSETPNGKRIYSNGNTIMTHVYSNLSEIFTE